MAILHAHISLITHSRLANWAEKLLELIKCDFIDQPLTVVSIMIPIFWWWMWRALKEGRTRKWPLLPIRLRTKVSCWEKIVGKTVDFWNRLRIVINWKSLILTDEIRFLQFSWTSKEYQFSGYPSLALLITIELISLRATNKNLPFKELTKFLGHRSKCVSFG